MTFWLTAAAATALCVVLLLRPLLRRPRSDAPRVDYDLRVYRDQLDELDRDLARGVLRREQVDAARTEIERRMLASAEAEGGETEDDVAEDDAAEHSGPADAQARRAAPRPSLWLAAATALLLPGAAVALYLWLGAPGLPNQPLAERTPGASTPADLIEQVRAQVAREPENREAWRVLAGLYAHQDRLDEAEAAYRRLRELVPEDRDSTGALAEILIAKADGAVGREARLLLAEIIKADPGNPRARYYAALAMSQDGLLQQAMEIWLGLLRDSTPDAPWVPLVRSQIEAAAAELGIEAPDFSESLPQGAPDAPGPDRDDVAAAAEMSDAERGAFIRSMVERLAARLEEEPEDLEGWLRLARAYQVLGELEQARGALRRAETASRDLPESAPLRQAVEQALEALPAAE